MKDKLLLIIDGNSLMYRAYYATAFNTEEIMRNSEGIPTNGILAFYNMLNAIIKKIKPTHIHIAFDAGKKTFRHNAFKDYKGGRKKTPTDLIVQFPILKQLLTELNITHSEIVNYEADDIIASLAKKVHNAKVVIMTSDRDLLQVIDDNISVIFNKNGVKTLDEYNINNIWEKLGIFPNQVVDYKILIGDPSDNIKGIPGIGPKSAVKLLKKYKTIEQILLNLMELPKKQRENISNNVDNINVWKNIIKLIFNLENIIPFEKMITPISPSGNVIDFLQKYELNSIANKLNISSKNHDENILKKINKQLIKNDNKTLKNIMFISIILDTENYHIGNGLSIGVYFQNQFKYYSNCLNDELVTMLLSNSKKILFNSKKIIKYYSLNGIKIQNIIDDIQLIYYVIDPSIEDNISAICSSQQLDAIHRAAYLTKTYIRKLKKNPETLLEFEVKMMSILYLKGINKLWDLELNDIYEKIEKPYQKILIKMEDIGVKLDLVFLRKFKVKISSLKTTCENKIFSLIGKTINLNSPQQLKSLIYDELEIKKIGKKNTSIESLWMIKEKHPLVPLLMEYRKWEKLESTYINSLLRFEKNSVIHTIFLQTKTETGRLSSIFPNMQNISTHNEDQKQIKKAFVSRKGYSFLFADYSQIELRILADLSNSKEYIDAFKNNVDIHTQTASKIFNVKMSEVDKDMRYKAKAVNFGIMYGITAFGLAKQLNINFYDADILIKNYKKQYPDLEKFQKQAIERCLKTLVIKTKFGRTRRLPKNYEKKLSFYKRVAINMPIQGTAADIIKIASINIEKQLNFDEAKLLLQIHDELVFEIKDEHISKYKKIIKNVMNNVHDFKVPLVTNITISKSLYY